MCGLPDRKLGRDAFRKAVEKQKENWMFKPAMIMTVLALCLQACAPHRSGCSTAGSTEPTGSCPGDYAGRPVRG